ncbi:BACK domain-containing protein [Aphelenchoides besseyi]|nr:BACK domain-containing protein [Aphelenchoides besseyi]KAI6187163.1 BACK domain-containing protein [Aphelenchoides besseyi]
MHKSIQSESGVNLNDPSSELFKYGAGDRQSIVLHTRRRNYPIAVQQFAKHSTKIKRISESHQVPREIDLTCYEVDAVRLLVDFLGDVNPPSLRINRQLIYDLLQLAAIFEIDGLKEKTIEHLIECMDADGRSSSGLQWVAKLIGSDWEVAADIRVREKFLALFSSISTSLFASNQFHRYSLPLVVTLLNKCDLPVKSEFQIAEMAIQWAAKNFDGQPTYAVLRQLLSTVRSSFLRDSDRAQLRIVAHQLFSADVQLVEAMDRLLDGARCSRLCLIAEHVKGHFARCGYPSGHDSRLQTGLPLISVIENSRYSDVKARPKSPVFVASNRSSIGSRTRLSSSDSYATVLSTKSLGQSSKSNTSN